MKIGTKSVLFGVHQFLLHPLFIAIGWWQEYGFRRVRIAERVAYTIVDFATGNEVDFIDYTDTSLLDPRLWLAFVVHDLGYIGKPNMDGSEGETHPELGARLMRRLFGDAWGDLCLLHSRYYAKRLNRAVSPLCAADKRVFLIEPAWLYLPRVWATGELAEYIAAGQRRAAAGDEPFTDSERSALASGNAWRWHRAVCSFMRRWIDEHRGGKADTWTTKRHAEVA